MLSLRLSPSAIARAPKPTLLLKCAAARYGAQLVKESLLPLAPPNQRPFSSTRKVEWGRRDREFFHNDSRLCSSDSNDFLHLDHHKPQESSLHYVIPMNTRQKVVHPKDAVALVRDGDTVCVSGFVSQGTPEAVLKALGENYESNGSPNKLTLLFGGGPGMICEREGSSLLLSQI